MLVSVYKHNIDQWHQDEDIRGLIEGLEGLSKPLTKEGRTEFKEELLKKIRGIGWSGKRKLFPSTSSISISSIKDDIGMCIQLGNIARYYADIVKLQHMHHSGSIREGVLIVYHLEAASRLFAGGGNLATYERVMRELGLMSDSISFPITLIGIG